MRLRPPPPIPRITRFEETCENARFWRALSGPISVHSVSAETECLFSGPVSASEILFLAGFDRSGSSVKLTETNPAVRFGATIRPARRASWRRQYHGADGPRWRPCCGLHEEAPTNATSLHPIHAKLILPLLRARRGVSRRVQGALKRTQLVCLRRHCPRRAVPRSKGKSSRPLHRPRNRQATMTPSRTGAE